MVHQPENMRNGIDRKIQQLNILQQLRSATKRYHDYVLELELKDFFLVDLKLV
jgi:hypothetical protein